MSQSSTSWNGDIGTRYERLAAEYAKLRASASVLKKGVLDERTKNEKLTEELKAAESISRKLRSENESLSFRNEQLLKRVQNVQDELEEALRSSSTKKSSKRDKESGRERQLETSLAILEEELRGKLIQNEKLTNKIEEVSSLNDMLTLQLRELKERIEEMDRDGRGLKSRIPERRREGEEGKRRGLSSSPRPSSPPTPSSTPEIAVSDSPLWQMAEGGRGVLSGMSTLLSLLEQRVRIFPYDASLERLPKEVEMLDTCLGEASKLFAAASEQADRLFEEPADRWRSSASLILSSMETAGEYCGERLEGLLGRLAQEESRCAWSDSRLEALNERWRCSLCRLLSSLSSLPSTIRGAMDGGGGGERGIEAVARAVGEVHAAVKATQESFSARWLVETRLPVQTKKGKCVGTATRDVLLKMLGVSQKVASRMEGMVKEEEERKEAVRREKETLEREEERRKEEEERLKSEEEDGKVVEDASLTPVPESKKLSSSTLPSRKDSIRSNKSGREGREGREEKERTMGARERSELDHLRARVLDLEREREKMMLEMTLMKRRVGGGGGDDACSLLQDELTVEMDRFYAGRMRETKERMIEAVARGDYYSRECSNLIRSVGWIESEKKKLEEEIEGMTREKLALFDELRTTQYGYESKLREMSEHVAVLNSEKEEREKEEKRGGQKNTLSRRLTLFK